MNNRRIYSILTMCASVVLGAAVFVLSEPITVHAQSDTIIDLPTGDLVNPTAREAEVYSETLSPEEFSELVGDVPKRRAKYASNDGYYYDQLTEHDKIYYNAILEASVKNIGASESFSEENAMLFYTGSSSLQQPNLTAILNAIEYDHPEQLESIMYGVQIPCKRTTRNGISTYAYYLFFTPESNYTGAQLAQMESTLQSSLNSFYAGLTLTGDDANMELIIHDALIDAVEYDYECANSYAAYDVAHTAYGALVDHSAVCDGYSKAFKMLLNKAGIDSEIVSGLGNGGGHAWNVVKIGSSWYETDVTWDDKSSYSDNKYYFMLSHEYFNLTTADIRSHLEDIPGFLSRTTTHERNSQYMGYLNPPVAYGTTDSYRNIKQVYKITFSGTLDGATVNLSRSYTYEGKVLDMPSYTYLYGYTFDNWYTEETGGSIVSSDTVFKNSSTVYARWNPKDAKLYLETGLGNTEVINLKFGEEFSSKLPNNLEKTGFVFVGWYLDSEYKNKVQDDTKVSNIETYLYARWISDGDHNIIYNANGGEVDIESTVLAGGEKFGSMPTPTRYGYTFGGWYDAAEDGYKITSNTIVTEDAVLYAHWTPVEVRIYFKKNDGSTAYQYKTVNYDGTYEKALNDLYQYTWNGHTFLGWYTEENGGTQITPDTIVNTAETHNLYAHWSIERYTVSFDSNGGSVDAEPVTVDWGTKYGELPTPVRYGYTFKGWYDGKESGILVSATDTIKKDTTLYARWTPIRSTVRFYVNVDAGSYRESNVNYNDTFASVLQNISNPVRDGYTFIGWYTEANGGNKITAETVVTTTDLFCVYAHWEKNASEENGVSDVPADEEEKPASQGNQNVGGKDKQNISDSENKPVEQNNPVVITKENAADKNSNKSQSGNDLKDYVVVHNEAKVVSTGQIIENRNDLASNQNSNGSLNSDTEDNSKNKDFSNIENTTKTTNVGTNGTASDSKNSTTSLKKGSTVVVNGATFVVTGTNEVEYKSAKTSNVETVSIPATIKINGDTYKITGIRSKAFRKNTKLKKVTIGKNVTKIGAQAFEGCSALTTVNGGSAVRLIEAKAFNGCKKLKKAPVGSKVTSIGNMAFYNCSSLTNMTIPVGVNKLGKQFAGKTPNLKTLTIKTRNLKAKGITNKAFTGMGSNKTVTRVPKGKGKTYKSLFQKKGLNKKIKIQETK